jgi:hypothetical protein
MKPKHHTKTLNLKSTIYLPEPSSRVSTILFNNFFNCSIVGKSYKREKNQNLTKINLKNMSFFRTKELRLRGFYN